MHSTKAAMNSAATCGTMAFPKPRNFPTLPDTPLANRRTPDLTGRVFPSGHSSQAVSASAVDPCEFCHPWRSCSYRACPSSPAPMALSTAPSCWPLVDLPRSLCEPVPSHGPPVTEPPCPHPLLVAWATLRCSRGCPVDPICWLSVSAKEPPLHRSGWTCRDLPLFSLLCIPVCVPGSGRGLVALAT